MHAIPPSYLCERASHPHDSGLPSGPRRIGHSLFDRIEPLGSHRPRARGGDSSSHAGRPRLAHLSSSFRSARRLRTRFFARGHGQNHHQGRYLVSWLLAMSCEVGARRGAEGPALLPTTPAPPWLRPRPLRCIHGLTLAIFPRARLLGVTRRMRSSRLPSPSMARTSVPAPTDHLREKAS